MHALVWFDRFLVEHLGRHPGAELPAPDSERGRALYDAWRLMLADVAGVDYDAATAASLRLLVEPASKAKHFAKLVEYVEAEIKQRPSAPRATNGLSRGEAEHESRSCERCDGSGYVQVWHVDPGSRYNTGNYAVSAHCLCVLGRWLRAHAAPEHVRHIPDLADVVRGVGPWREYDPAKLEITDPRTKPF